MRSPHGLHPTVSQLVSPDAGRIESGMITDGRPVTQRRKGRAFRGLAAFVATSVALAGMPATHAYAQDPARGIPLIRDSEIEQLLRFNTQPILRAAGVAQQNIRVVIINDRAFNAFVADGKSIFVNIGVLMDAATPNEVIGVLAHESGHLAGGHLAGCGRRSRTRRSSRSPGCSSASAAWSRAARSGGSSMGNAGIGAMGAIAGPQELVRRSLLAYQRSEEQAADRAAVRFLAAAGMSAKGMLTVFRRFAENGAFLSQAIDPYTISHPMPRERIAQLETLARQSPNFDKPDPAVLQTRHDLMRAKLMGFVEREGGVARRYGMADQSMAARYARAISDYRSGRMAQALAAMDRLIGEQPKNAYFLELKGQALLEAGRAREAVPVLRQAVALAPQAGLIRQMLGHALLQTGDRRLLDEAIRELSNAATREPDISDGYAQLAMAYGRKGDLAQADLASAQAAFTREACTARQLAARAKGRFPVGSPGWVKSDDIASYKPPTPNARQ